MQIQLGFPVQVHEDELARKKTLGEAIGLCTELSNNKRDKTTGDLIGVDKGQLSRWKSGGEGIMWPKFVNLMDICGNDAPLLWMLMQRGYDLSSLRKRESETEQRLRMAMEALEEERAKRVAVEESMRRILTGTA